MTFAMAHIGAIQSFRSVRFENNLHYATVVLPGNQGADLDTLWTDLLNEETTAGELGHLGRLLRDTAVEPLQPPGTPLAPSDVNVLIESEWHGVPMANANNTIAAHKETFYVLKANNRSVWRITPYETDAFRAELATWPGKYPPSSTTSYLDRCLAVTHNTGPGACNNLMGELIHAITEETVFNAIRGLQNVPRFSRNTPIQPQVFRYRYTEPDDDAKRWAARHVRDMWTTKEQRRATRRNAGGTINVDRVKPGLQQLMRLIRAIFKHYCEQVTTFELRGDDPQLYNLYNTTINAQTQQIQMAERTPLTWSAHEEVGPAGKLAPDFLFCVDAVPDPPPGNQAPVFDMGTELRRNDMNNREQLHQLDYYTFPGKGRMYAIELKTTRGYPKSNDNLNTYIYEKIVRYYISSVGIKYRRWKFNGTVFIIIVVYPWEHVIVVQLDINDYAVHEPGRRYNLQHYFQNTPV